MNELIFPRPTFKGEDGCIFVVSRTGGKMMDGERRPLVSFEGEIWKGHRLSYHLNNGAIPRAPEGGCSARFGLVLHTCDKKSCVNPEHLYLGSRSQNAQDNADRNQSWRLNLSASLKDKPQDPQFVKRRTANLKGRSRSEETKKKISSALKGNSNRAKSLASQN